LPAIDINIVLNVVLGLIMFGLGLSLTLNDFKHLFNHPRSLGVGLFAQMLLLPLVAWFIADDTFCLSGGNYQQLGELLCKG
jgi:predicted Na+-dependent transporter